MPSVRPCHAVLLRIRKAGAGSGTLSMWRGGFQEVPCEPVGACDGYYYEGSYNVLEATADPGSVFRL
jgi:hypothetical protein